jgi:uncharacterized membrane protein (UPF0127 family)
MPYLLALATSSNIGSVMTVTGNPQNMLIGIYSKIPYLSFLGALFPVALAGFVVCIAVIWFIYRKEMSTKALPSRPAIPRYQVKKALLVKALLVCAAVLVSFSLGQPYSLTAAAGAVALLLIGRVRTERILEGVDWTLLAFFAGLFVVMHGVEESGLAGAAINWIGDLSALSPAGRIAGLSLVSMVLSNVVSNVPAVMLLKPLTLSLGGGKFIWLALAMSSTLAGNLTLIGSVANLIVAQQAKRKVDIGFMEYFRVGALITAITIAIGILVLVVEVKIGNGAELPVITGHVNQKSVIVTSVGQKARERTLRVALFCDTEDLRTKGLQGFRRLAADEAALFVFEDLVEVTFWMGSVDFPIDIIFVGQDRKVVQVYQNCRPGSLDLYPSGKPVLWVIETAGGSGIRVGDRISFK